MIGTATSRRKASRSKRRQISACIFQALKGPIMVLYTISHIDKLFVTYGIVSTYTKSLLNLMPFDILWAGQRKGDKKKRTKQIEWLVDFPMKI